MKIALVSPASFPATQFGGIMFLVADIAKEAANLGNDVVVYTTDLDFANNPKTFNKKLPREENIQNFKIKRSHVWFSIRLFFVNPGMYFRMINDQQDIIHTIGIRSFQSFIAALVAKKKKIPLFVSDQGGLTTHPDLQTRNVWTRILYKIQSPMIRFVIGQAKKIIVANEYEKKIFSKLADENKIEIVENGINLEKMKSNIDFKNYATPKIGSDFINIDTYQKKFYTVLIDIDKQYYKSLLKKSTEPIIRKSVKKAVTILARQFVFKPTIEEGMKFTESEKYKKNIFSFDMLGEGARTMEDAERYFQDYINSIHAVGKLLNNSSEIKYANGVSIKISALHPRYERNKSDDLEKELLPKLVKLCEISKQYNIQLCIDAEENYRLILSLKILDKLSSNRNLLGWNGLGLAVQAYQKRAFYVIDWLNELAKKDNRVINVRLVKGAYWDSEIKLAQELGVPNYPVFTRKSLTDLSWMACAIKLFSMQQNIFPQFASHNAYSIAFIEEFGKDKIFEFQRIHGMADKIHHYFNRHASDNYQKCRIYAPVGEYDDLLPYLMRRLLENGANTSFINKINNPNTSYILFLARKAEILSASNNINNPLSTIAIAITINAVVEFSISLVNPIAANIESKENTKFIITILVITTPAVFMRFGSSLFFVKS